MSTREETKPTAGKLKKPSEKVDRYYICPGDSSRTFYIPVRDDNGKRVPERDGRGNQKYSGDTALTKMRLIRFEAVVAKLQLTENFKSMCAYSLKANDRQYADKLKELERMRLDPSNMVMNKEMYEKWRNPEAADALITNKVLREENADKDDIIAKMTADIDALNKKLESGSGNK